MIGTEQIIDAETADAEDQAPRWFDLIETTGDPWRDWFGMLAFPRRHGPLDAEIEHRVEELCRAADMRRLAVTPTTARFADIWATFRRHHEALEQSWSHRRKRWLVWRAAALKVMHDRGGFQDDADASLVRAKLVETLGEFWPGIKPDGSCPGYSCNFWRPEAVTVALAGRRSGKDTAAGVAAVVAARDEFARHGIELKTPMPDPLAEYAATVLALVKIAAEEAR